MADNVKKLPDRRQVFSGFRKASEILREQSQPKFTADSTSKPIFFPLDSVPVSQPDERIFTTIGSDFYSSLPRAHTEVKDTICFERQSQSSLPNFTECPNAVVTNNKGGFIKASALTNVISQKHYEVNTKKSLSKTGRFFTDLNPSPDTENLPQFGEGSQQTNDSGDFYQYPTTSGHNALTNPFLCSSMLNRVPSLPLPRWKKKRTVANNNNQTTGVGDSSITTYMYKLNKVPASTVSMFTKKKIAQMQTQRNITSFCKVSAREKCSNSYDEKYCDISIRPGGRFKRKDFSSISMDSSQAESKFFSEDCSDDEEKQTSTNIKEDQSSSSSSDDERPEDYNLSKSHYGLFGCDSAETSTGEDVYFQQLPDELKRIIFCLLPATQLFEVCSNVCKDWRRIIYNEKFMLWKYRYFCLKKKNTRYWATPYGMFDFYNTGVEWVISQMKCQTSTFQDLLPSLKKHVYHKEAMFVFETSFQDCYIDNVPSPWSFITLLFIISDTVQSMEQLLKILASATSKSSFDILLDKVYQILYLLTYKRYWDSTHVLASIVYRLTCALYIFENSGTTTVADINQPMLQQKQQSILRYCESSKKIRLSAEQLKIINLHLKPGDVIKILAYAGTGKTTTLVRFTKMNPNLKFLLVVYNKSVAEYAKAIFPKHVYCTTGHGLAYKSTGYIYAKNCKLHLRNLKVCDLENALSCDRVRNNVLHCQVVLTTLEKFFASKETEIQEHHVTSAMSLWEKKITYSYGFDVKHWLDDANYIWRQMIDLNNKKVKMTHDGYLKLYQIQKPHLTKYDVILIDEAQDLTPAIADILISQKQAKVLVGDPHQQIYSFRGAMNVMSSIEATQTYYLTQSFRFGHEIASVANLFLDYHDQSNILVGSSKESTIEGKEIGQVAYISRSNSVLFKMAAFVCCVQRPKVKAFFIGGLNSWEFDLLRRLCIFRDEGYFKHSSSSRDIFLSKFPTYWALSRYVKESLDGELLPKVQILEQYTSNLHKVLSYIEASEVKDIKHADVIFTTAHKAKGLEFSTVKILEDFAIDSPEERNLLYVAVTRAKNSLFIENKILSLQDKVGGLNLKVRRFDSLDDEKLQCCCDKCYEEIHTEFTPPIIVEKKRLRLVGDTETGGFICKRCLKKRHSSMSFLYEKPKDDY